MKTWIGLTGGHRTGGRSVAVVAAVVALGGCAVAPQRAEAPVVLGPPVRQNVTPMEVVLACMGDRIAMAVETPPVISVGDVKDYTGKYNINEGSAITQGGALMVYSALGKLGGAIRVAERFDPVIAERELSYADRRQLGDGQVHRLGGANGAQTVPWLPYFGGTIQKSDYFIVGGITELNYNINSGGAQAGVNQASFRARTFTQSVGVDLRIVNTKTLLVTRTVSLTKQFNGYEVGFNIFRFFGTDLFDIDIGAKGQEPLQLGIRAALEEGVARLVGAVTEVDPQSCLRMRMTGESSRTPAERLRKVGNPVPAASASPVQGAVAVNADNRNGTQLSGFAVQIPFEFGAATLSGGALTLLDQVAATAAKSPTDVVLVARDTENWDASKRDALTDQRIALVSSALAGRGIGPGAITVIWRPDKADTSIHRGGPGLQEIARLRVSAGAGVSGKSNTGVRASSS